MRSIRSDGVLDAKDFENNGLVVRDCASSLLNPSSRTEAVLWEILGMLNQSAAAAAATNVLQYTIFVTLGFDRAGLEVRTNAALRITISDSAASESGL